jgi:Siphovirus ReqiPepy6 Gp37-like protein
MPLPLPPVAEPPYTIEVRDASRQRTGLIDRLTTMELTPTFNAVGGWSLTLPDGTPQAAAIVKGGWVSFFSGGQEIVTGHVRGLERTWSEQDPGAGTLRAYGPTAEQLIADRLAFQVPGQPATTQSGAEYDRRSGAGETVIKAYVNLNAGPGAIVARRTTGLVIETDAGRGATVLGSARMTPLLDLIGPLALSAGLGFRIHFNASDQLEFQIYLPADRTGTARFGRELGNMVSYQHTEEASKASAAIVGGSGDGTARVFREVLDSAAITAWSGIRNEVFVDRRDTADATELDQAATEETVTDGPTDGLDIQTMDIPNLKFGVDYYLGDKVSAEDIQDVLRSVTIRWAASDGATTTSTVGTASVTGTRRMINQLADLNKKVADLQAKK